MTIVAETYAFVTAVDEEARVHVQRWTLGLDKQPLYRRPAAS